MFPFTQQRFAAIVKMLHRHHPSASFSPVWWRFGGVLLAFGGGIAIVCAMAMTFGGTSATPLEGLCSHPAGAASAAVAAVRPVGSGPAAPAVPRVPRPPTGPLAIGPAAAP